MHVQYHGDHVITNKISIVSDNKYSIFFPLGSHKKEKSKNDSTTQYFFSKIRIKTLELAFKLLGGCHIYIYSKNLEVIFFI
jgi:hypothetical protein